MRLPKRPSSHVTESSSWRILQAELPDEWIIREVTERDYGIDCYVELVTPSLDVTGDLVSIQLKGKDHIDWKKKERIKYARYHGIEQSTANYWMNQQVPVFLFVAEISTDSLFFCPVKDVVRTYFAKFLKQKTFSFPLSPDYRFGANKGLSIFLREFDRERLNERFSYDLVNLLSHLQRYSDYIRENYYRDEFLEVEPERHLELIQLYNTCESVSNHLLIDWNIEPMEEIYKKDKETWKDNWCYLHEKSQHELLCQIDKIFLVLVRKAIDYVINKQGDYWLNTDPVFFNLCNSDDVEWLIKRIEHEATMP